MIAVIGTLSFATTAGGPLIVVLLGTAILWWFSPIEAGESGKEAAKRVLEKY